MLQKKKLAYYAKQNGIEDYTMIKLSEEDCGKICSKIGIVPVSASDFGGDMAVFISIVMDKPEFIEAHRKAEIPEELLRMRCGDYAAIEVFKAYSEL